MHYRFHSDNSFTETRTVEDRMIRCSKVCYLIGRVKFCREGVSSVSTLTVNEFSAMDKSYILVVRR